MRMPDCIRCHDNRSVYHDGDRNYFCTACKIAFDDDPDEAGDYYTDPTRRIEREEKRATRRRKRLKPR